jgi:hypothetical protein
LDGGKSNGRIPPDAKLYLITTSSVGSDSAASYLMLEERNEVEALAKLRATASTSTSRDNRRAYSLFRALSSDEQEELARSVFILSRAPNITAVGEALRKETRLAVKRNHLESFLSRLEGWWYIRTIKHLIESDAGPILSSEIEGVFDDIREQFKPDSLPVDQDILEADIDFTDYEDMLFVKQVKLTGIRKRRILTAIRDYYRAFEQRSRWVREDLIFIGELDVYENLLREEWELEFDRVADELGDNAAEEAKKNAAQQIYSWVEKSCFPIRQVHNPCITRGSFHILSDSLKVGWHPEFMTHLQQVLEPQGVS